MRKPFPLHLGLSPVICAVGVFTLHPFFFSLSEAKTACFSKKHKCPLR